MGGSRGLGRVAAGGWGGCTSGWQRVLGRVCQWVAVGAGEGVPVVAAEGWGGCARAWQQVMWLFLQLFIPECFLNTCCVPE